MFNFLKKTPKKGSLYAIPYGTHKGKFFIYIKTDSDGHKFLMTPDMLNITVPIDEFDKGVEHGIVELVEVLPKYVTAEVTRQFKENIGNPERIYNR